MIVLHNVYDELSRQAVETLPAGSHYVIDWFNGGQEAWLAAGGSNIIQAFPTTYNTTPPGVDLSALTSCLMTAVDATALNEERNNIPAPSV